MQGNDPPAVLLGMAGSVFLSEHIGRPLSLAAVLDGPENHAIASHDGCVSGLTLSG